MYLILRQWGKSKWGFIAWCDTLRCDVPFLCVSEVLWSISSFLASWLLLQSANVATITNSWWRWRWWRWWWRTNTNCISLPFVQLLRVQTPLPHCYAPNSSSSFLDTEPRIKGTSAEAALPKDISENHFSFKEQSESTVKQHYCSSWKSKIWLMLLRH